MSDAGQCCGCGRDAIDVVRIASEDGVLLMPVCSECIDDPIAEQPELFEPTRRPLRARPPRGSEPQQSSWLDDAAEDDRGAA